MTAAYPLAWPAGWPRTDPAKRERARFKVTLAGALRFLSDELRRLGATNIVLSSNVTLGRDNANDPGVCAYFLYQMDQAAIPCDRWSTVADNVQAIAKTIEALRGIDRWGAKHMVRAAFRGFAALPPPGAVRSWRDVLSAPVDCTRDNAEILYRFLARKLHPDSGGSHDAMAELNRAIELARKELPP